MIPVSKLTNADDFSKYIRNPSAVLIDVRSPSEFAEDHIPGAINLPVLNDAERAEVGTIYKNNPFHAKQKGARLISRNISILLETVENLSLNFSLRDAEFLVYCWRGGMRSRSLFTVMDLIGYRTRILDGGYKAYRKKVMEYFNSGLNQEFIILHGPSGSGKSELIRLLKSEGHPAVDLEEIANHRGSALGFLGEQPSQKFFESELFSELYRWKKSSFIMMEGESRKIGRLHLPDFFYKKMLHSRKLWVELPPEIRAERLAEQYNAPAEILLENLKRIRKYLHSDAFRKIEELIMEGNRKKAAEILLSEHYDRFYRVHFNPGKREDFFCRFYSDSFESLLEEITGFTEKYSAEKKLSFSAV